MMRIIMFAAVAIALAALGVAAGLHFSGTAGHSATKPAQKDAHGHSKGDDHKDGGVEMSDAKVAAAGIELAKAGPAELRETFRLNGIIQANQEALVQVTPRFPGVVKELRKRLGDKVAKGDVLATVESNQSLTTFDLRAPIGGTIIERQAALGEYVSEQKPIFIVADLTTAWIDFSVYKRDFSRVRVGDTVVVDIEDGGPAIETKIAYVSPLGASDTQSALARAVVANDGRLRPGLFVTGRLLLAVKPVDIAIKLSALQTIEGRTVVFVRNGDKFDVRDVELGNRDEDNVEVLFGVLPDELYAAKNSFIIKAELAKGSASHEH
ncbi:MAG TPA: efflux RND transporter periplasmic adaptor subunit [Vineibacter sp.]|nr:efflux RND transporter periplasmic adaptor subunit [Vineibacter sp.]